MRIGGSILLDLVDKLRHLIPWDKTSSDSKMPGDTNISCKMCCEKDGGLVSIKGCKFCAEVSAKSGFWRKGCEKVHPRDSPEPPSPCLSGSGEADGSVNVSFINRDSLEHGDHGYSPRGSISTDFSARPWLPSVRCSPNRCRSVEEEVEGSGKHVFSPMSESHHDNSDADTPNFSVRHDSFNSFKSVGSTPLDSPSRHHFKLNRGGHFVDSCDYGPFSQEETMAVLKRPGAGSKVSESTYYCSNDLSIFHSQCGRSQKSFDFENNDLIWYPPLPDNEKDETEGNYFEYDDDDEDEYTASSSLSCMSSWKERQSEGNKESLRALVQGHFRALVSQLLYGEGIKMGQEKGQDWVDIVTSISWQAANFVKPDTSRGGSMDPCDYVKVKCVASGSPNESTLVKGVVCTKNVKHRRMTSQYKNPRVLILGGSLEYQRVPNQLASFDKLLEQEIDHLKMIISKIEAFHPNVLLVEKSVSSYAQEYLLAKGISLVLNVKRPLLERISRCTGAPITPSTESISTTRLGHCELFRLERVSEDREACNQSSRKPSKALMYFEGCPRRLGCTVILRGASREELKKVKHVIQYAVFAAYHLSLETSFLVNEGATIPEFPPNPSTLSSENTASENRTSIVSTYSDEEGYITESEFIDTRIENFVSDASDGDVGLSDALDSKDPYFLPCRETRIPSHLELTETVRQDGENEVSGEYFSSTDTNQSILVSFSSRCVIKRIVCERSRLLRIKFYGCFDKPLGRYLRDDLFDQTSCCQSCEEPAEAHVRCYTHQHGNLTVNVKRVPSVRLPGEKDGKIWMWHRCLKCAYNANGLPPATRRVVMSDAAWGLSFGKFLELSFSNHATANRVATCGHSLQRDCLRYYGFGSMVAFFRYSPIGILSVYLPPPVLDFNGHARQEWLRKEAGELMDKMEALYMEISGVLEGIEHRCAVFGKECLVTPELQNYIVELKNMLKGERTEYIDMLEPALADSSHLDILELNCLRHSLVTQSHVWDRQLYSLDLLLKTKNSAKAAKDVAVCNELKVLKISDNKEDSFSESISFNESNLYERIDSAWTGSEQMLFAGRPIVGSLDPTVGNDSPPLRPLRRLMAPVRVHSFDSAVKTRERVQLLSTVRSFHASGDFRNMVKDPTALKDAQKPKLSSSIISCGTLLASGPRLLVPHAIYNNIMAVYDDEPTSIISYALCSKEHDDWVSDKSDGNDWSKEGINRETISAVSSFSSLHSLGVLDIDQVNSYGSYTPKDATPTSPIGSIFRNTRKSPHLRVSFMDESSPTCNGKVKFSVMCYFGKEFESLRTKCCPSEVDFVRSLSRCRRWNAQGGKSNVYFAKSMDERFIIKQVTKTELDSFEDIASEYFKYLNESLSSGSPTCLAKVLGLYQVMVKHPTGGKETKMDLMVMENLFFNRTISRVYDLKGSNGGRYNPDTTGKDKVLLDSNLLETLRTKPIFLGSKAKRSLERAIWNDTSFLASVDVMDYSLLVGVDEESKQLVVGIIDFMRQYTWDKHLETWVKASGILGGPKNSSPTIVSPKQYKKRFRKAMTAYFLTLPDQWSSS